ncbi:uncharacterized protein LOC106708561 [Papilio machaon]|uniref:uncharacterized protein LOC106708561 n=1 Tax=Papilio machaon TaxID=76193 RepID=UPI001E6629AC|nr:uncharacterized protein LOC106708561 [Papilio machaon]
MDIFYRRVIGEQFKDESWKWALCQDIITPYLTGVKKRPMEMSKIGLKDATPERMFHLLGINMSEYAKEDVFALMYQISKVQIRLYQWDVMPIRVLINLLVKGKAHTFRNLKASMREMFEIWHLDFRNLTKIIEQTRIIRPACTITSQYTGSTKTAKVSRYKEFMTTTTKF